MTPVDECCFSDTLLVNFPALVFLDNDVWFTKEFNASEEMKGQITESVPVVADSVKRCKSLSVYFWNKTIDPELIVESRLRRGRFEGACKRVWLQFLRSRLEGNILEGGRIAASFDKTDIDAKNYVSRVWSTLEQLGTKKVSTVDRNTRSVLCPHETGMFIGNDAVSWVLENPARSLKVPSSVNFVMPSEAR